VEKASWFKENIMYKCTIYSRIRYCKKYKEANRKIQIKKLINKQAKLVYYKKKKWIKMKWLNKKKDKRHLCKMKYIQQLKSLLKKVNNQV
jgi:hypothetical protein